MKNIFCELICFVSFYVIAYADLNYENYIFKTNRLPSDERYMCSIGNGHIATNVYSNTLYMNGLYNGKNGESHRARIPTWTNIRISNSTLNNAINGSITFSLNTYHGYFALNFHTKDGEIEHRTYAHRFYTRAIINQITITTHQRSMKVELETFPGKESSDIDFKIPLSDIIVNRTVWDTCGKTKVLEDPKYQPLPSEVCIYWTGVPKSINVSPNKTVTYTYVMTVDTIKEVAYKEMYDVLQIDHEILFNGHKKEWEEIIQSGNIFISGSSELSKVVNAAWYYLQSSLPSLNSNQHNNPFYGLSPGGLARGALLEDYQGHNFWDTETWMYPPILLLNPKLALELLKYRILKSDVASDLANITSHRGIRFPWESAFTGREVTEACCPEVAEYQHHITGCIAFAIRQYIAVTYDIEWLKESGCTLVRNIAEFWSSRVEYNNITGFYDIKRVMGPDEEHSNVTNSIFTNVVAGYALYLGNYASCLCGMQDNPAWTRIAKKLSFPYNAELDYNPQFDGYERPTKIKQADTVLLGFPLLYKMNTSTKRNNLEYYGNVTRERGPAMTWSMHSIGHLQLEDYYQAEILFNRSYQPYVKPPFNIWTETIDPEISAINFITGMGGFLQAIISGYGGVNIYLDRLEINTPRLIPHTSQVDINKIKYLGSELTINLNSTTILLKVNTMNQKVPLVLQRNNEVIELYSNMREILDGKGPFVIKSANLHSCTLPLDLIGQ